VTSLKKTKCCTAILHISTSMLVACEIALTFLRPSIWVSIDAIIKLPSARLFLS